MHQLHSQDGDSAAFAEESTCYSSARPMTLCSHPDTPSTGSPCRSAETPTPPIRPVGRLELFETGDTMRVIRLGLWAPDDWDSLGSRMSHCSNELGLYALSPLIAFIYFLYSRILHTGCCDGILRPCSCDWNLCRRY